MKKLRICLSLEHSTISPKLRTKAIRTRKRKRRTRKTRTTRKKRRARTTRKKRRVKTRNAKAKTATEAAKATAAAKVAKVAAAEAVKAVKAAVKAAAKAVAKVAAKAAPAKAANPVLLPPVGVAGGSARNRAAYLTRICVTATWRKTTNTFAIIFGRKYVAPHWSQDQMPLSFANASASMSAAALLSTKMLSMLFKCTFVEMWLLSKPSTCARYVQADIPKL